MTQPSAATPHPRAETPRQRLAASAWISRPRPALSGVLPGGGPRRHRRRALVLLVADVLALGAAFGLGAVASALVTGAPVTAKVPAVALAVTLAVSIYAVRGLYSAFAMGPVSEVRTLGLSTLVAGAVAGLVVGAPWTVGLGAVVGVLLAPMGRAAARAAFARRSWWACRAVVIGAGATGRAVVKALHDQPELGLRPVSVLDDDPRKRRSIDGVPVAGPVSLARRFADEGGVEYAVVAMPGASRQRTVEVVERYATRFDRVLVMPDLLGLGSLSVSARDLGGAIGLEVHHRLLTPWRQAAKRAVDLVGAVAGLVLLALPLAVIALAVRLESPGPAVFRQLRLGRGGRCFRCLKFRTMHLGADERLAAYLADHPEAQAQWDRYKKLPDDPRVTRVGVWLRRLSLDEVPQLWNVLRGEMSLVGPRAYLPRELDDMRGKTWPILRVRPGITGLWQVSGRSTVPFEGRLDFDVRYVRDWSFSLDLYLLARTIPAVLTSHGAS